MILDLPPAIPQDSRFRLHQDQVDYEPLWVLPKSWLNLFVLIHALESAIQNDFFECLFHPNSDTTLHLWTSMNFVSLYGEI